MNKKNNGFNLTTVILKMYENKLDRKLVKELMKDVDYSQVSEQMIYFDYNGSQQWHKESETLALNIIHKIPFEAYKDLMTADWINYGKDSDYPLTKQILYKIPVVSHLMDLGLEHYLKNTENDSFQYRKKVIEPVIDLENIFLNSSYYGKSKEFFDDFFNLFTKALKQYNQIRSIEAKRFDYKFKKNNNWLLNFDFFYDYRATPEQKTISMLKNMFACPHAEKFHDEFFEQLLKKSKISKNPSELIDKYLKNEEIILSIVSSGNTKVQKRLIDDFGFQVQDFTKVIDEELNNSWKDAFTRTTRDYEEQKQEKSKLAQSFLFLNSIEPCALSNLALFYISKDENIKKYLNKYLNINKKLPMTYNQKRFSPKDYMVAYELLNDYIDNFFTTKPNALCKAWILGKNINELGLQIKDKYSSFNEAVNLANMIMEGEMKNFFNYSKNHKNVEGNDKNVPSLQHFKIWSQCNYLEKNIDPTTEEIKSSKAKL